MGESKGCLCSAFCLLQLLQNPFIDSLYSSNGSRYNQKRLVYPRFASGPVGGVGKNKGTLAYLKTTLPLMIALVAIINTALTEFYRTQITSRQEERSGRVEL